LSQKEAEELGLLNDSYQQHLMAEQFEEYLARKLK
jgi:hypothetical protein